jgi:hypothetical protein
MVFMVQRGTILCLRFCLYFGTNGRQCGNDCAVILSYQCSQIRVDLKISITSGRRTYPTFFLLAFPCIPGIRV